MVPRAAAMVLVPEARSSRQEVRQAIAAQFWGQTASGVRSLNGVSRCAALQSPQAAAHADHIRKHASHHSGTSGLYAIGSSARLLSAPCALLLLECPPAHELRRLHLCSGLQLPTCCGMPRLPIEVNTTGA